MITLTAAAKDKIMKTMEAPETRGYHLRIGMAGNACRGKFIVGLDKPGSTDELHFFEGVSVIIDRKHLMHVAGKKLDYLTVENESFFALI